MMSSLIANGASLTIPRSAAAHAKTWGTREHYDAACTEPHLANARLRIGKLYLEELILPTMQTVYHLTGHRPLVVPHRAELDAGLFRRDRVAEMVLCFLVPYGLIESLNV